MAKNRGWLLKVVPLCSVCGKQCSGRLEICRHDQWEPICSLCFDLNAPGAAKTLEEYWKGPGAYILRGRQTPKKRITAWSAPTEQSQLPIEEEE